MKLPRPRSQARASASIFLSRANKLAIYIVLLSTWGSGAGWLLFHYFLRQRGPFGLEPNPFEACWLTLHGAGAFACLWLGGWLWSRHVMPWWRSDRRRVSGLVLIGLGAVLILTGYLLYYASADRLRQVVSLSHWISGLVLALPLAIHAVRGHRHRHSRESHEEAAISLRLS